MFTVADARVGGPHRSCSRYADCYGAYALASLGFGFVGSSFSVGIAYTSVWFSKERQGTALGVFGAGNAGSAITSIAAPILLALADERRTDIEGWRALPRIYAGALVLIAIAVLRLSRRRKVVEGGRTDTMRQRLAPLKEVRVWRFGLYYFLVFGGFVALAQLADALLRERLFDVAGHRGPDDVDLLVARRA